MKLRFELKGRPGLQMVRGMQGLRPGSRFVPVEVDGAGSRFQLSDPDCGLDGAGLLDRVDKGLLGGARRGREEGSGFGSPLMVRKPPLRFIGSRKPPFRFLGVPGGDPGSPGHFPKRQEGLSQGRKVRDDLGLSISLVQGTAVCAGESLSGGFEELPHLVGPQLEDARYDAVVETAGSGDRNLDLVVVPEGEDAR